MITERPGFTEYLRSGWQIQLHIAIDYTASNGAITTPGSLHSMVNGGANNQYLAAISQVGQILEEYSHDKMYPTWGFGGVPYFMNMQVTSHCFPLTGNFENNKIPFV